MAAATTDLTRAQVMKLARAKWGDGALVEDRGKLRRGASSPERRKRASDAASADPRPTFRPLPEWPAEATLGEYRAALAAHNVAYAAWKKRDGLRLSEALYYRFRIGEASGLFYHIHGEGDTWREAAVKAGLVTEAAP